MLDIDTLLQPITPEQPVGKDLRATQNADYDAIKEARADARRQERETMHDESAVPDLGRWRKIAELAPRLLAEQSKDLQIAAWLVEANVRLQGFSGLRQGLGLLKGLITNFWPDLYPEEDEDGLISKLYPLVGLNGEHSEGALIAPIYSAPLLETGGTEISAWHYQQALNHHKITDPQKIAQLEKSGAITLEQIRLTAHGASLSQLQTRIEDIEACLGEVAALRDKLQEICGAYEAPSMNYIQNTLKICLDAAQALKKMVAPVQTSSAEPEEAQDQISKASPAKFSGEANSKQEALQQLEHLARYFKHHEPHSPVAYLLEKALYWSTLSLPELLAQLIPDDRSLDYSYQMLGVNMQPPESEKGDYMNMEEDIDNE